MLHALLLLDFFFLSGFADISYDLEPEEDCRPLMRNQIGFGRHQAVA